MAQGAGLAGNAAAGDSGHDIHFAGVSGRLQGLADDHLQGLQAKIIVDVPAVDGDASGSAGEQVDAGDGGLPAAGTVQIGLFRLIHTLPPYSASRAMGFWACCLCSAPA